MHAKRFAAEITERKKEKGEREGGSGRLSGWKKEKKRSVVGMNKLACLFVCFPFPATTLPSFSSPALGGGEPNLGLRLRRKL